MSIELAIGDITAQDTDVIVNAANSSLLGGSGVDGAIHRKGGPDILAECRKLRAGRYGRGLPTGQAVATTAGRLPAKWVVHTVGPVWSSSEDRSALLADCHRNSLLVARELGATSIAFPAISTGVYRWPLRSAASIAVAAVREFTDLRVLFVLFSEEAYAAYDEAMSA
ncbi:O-acetyl-ADP-ribose deacetylase [Kibdelosporangium lantanae]